MDQQVILLGAASTVVLAAGKEDTGGAFALLDYELAPGFAALPPHIHHNEDEAMYVLEGQLQVRIGETERLLGPGGFVYLPREILHAQRNPGPEPVRFLMLLIPAGSEQCFADLEAALREGAPFTAQTIAPLFARQGVQIMGETQAEA